MKKVLLFLLFFSLGQSFAQSKKEQIAGLQFQLDSLKSKLTLERNLAKQNEEILYAKIVSLKEEINEFQLQKKELNGALEKKEAVLEEVNKRLETAKEEIFSLNNKYDKLSVSYTTLSKASAEKDNQLVRLFVEKFYRSLEPSPELYVHQIFNRDEFDLQPFYALLDLNVVYSKERILAITGEGHEYIKMSLSSIDDIKITNQVAEIITSVEYRMYEAGLFINEEKLTINLASTKPALIKWEDIGVKKFELYGEFIEDASVNTFYELMGRGLKK
jgi:hypothetical protein